MVDRALLELAAKAAGYEVRRGGGHLRGMLFMPVANPNGLVTGREWNPITDDGDALRLAVKLRLSILPDGAGIDRQTVEVIGNTGAEVEPWAWETLDGGDPYAATRRAIVRAAAAIGSAP